MASHQHQVYIRSYLNTIDDDDSEGHLTSSHCLMELTEQKGSNILFFSLDKLSTHSGQDQGTTLRRILSPVR